MMRRRLVSRGRPARPALRRPQRVRFRRRYATGVARGVAARAWSVVRLGAVAALVVWGARSAVSFYRTGEVFRVQDVMLSGDVPSGAEAVLGVSTGDNILSFRPTEAEARLLKAFPELRSVNVRRGFDRRISVEGSYRFPVAYVRREGRLDGMDDAGVMFPVPEGVPSTGRPLIDGEMAEPVRRAALDTLLELRQEAPEFCARIERMETDKMRSASIFIDGGVVIDWGELGRDDAALKAGRIEAILERFAPTADGAHLRFVTLDRVVMDAHWAPRPEQGG